MLLVLMGGWYTFVLVAFPRSSHYPYDTMTQTKRTLEDLALAAGEMDEATFLQGYFEPCQKVSMGGTTYQISYIKEYGAHKFTAVPKPRVYSSSLVQRVFFLDFTRIEYPTYAIDSQSRELREQR
ncbi:MAG: hypothetical protein A2Y76_08450 [Planctomycetes bacterium RBG_13_60_9]|nr:MAG: hypothetical protein A2Y76_08450 [Planctomycetes bacterium RBG_13_60_9]